MQRLSENLKQIGAAFRKAERSGLALDSGTTVTLVDVLGVLAVQAEQLEAAVGGNVVLFPVGDVLMADLPGGDPESGDGPGDAA